MAIIQTDPSQTKTVVALLGILVVAIGVTVVRIRPAPVASVAKPRAATSQAAPVSVTEEPSCLISRNPFAKPAGVPNAGPDNDRDQLLGPVDGLPGGFGDLGMGPNPYRAAAKAEIEPLDLKPMLEARQSTRRSPKVGPAAKVREPAGPRPEFALLATVRSAKGYSAVIRAGQSEVQVVEVGDVMSGAYRVEMIDDDRAVLTDGRETIVAKRP